MITGATSNVFSLCECVRIPFIWKIFLALELDSRGLRDEKKRTTGFWGESSRKSFSFRNGRTSFWFVFFSFRRLIPRFRSSRTWRMEWKLFSSFFLSFLNTFICEEGVCWLFLKLKKFRIKKRVEFLLLVALGRCRRRFLSSVSCWEVLFSAASRCFSSVENQWVDCGRKFWKRTTS